MVTSSNSIFFGSTSERPLGRNIENDVMKSNIKVWTGWIVMLPCLLGTWGSSRIEGGDELKNVGKAKFRTTLVPRLLPLRGK